MVDTGHWADSLDTFHLTGTTYVICMIEMLERPVVVQPTAIILFTCDKLQPLTGVEPLFRPFWRSRPPCLIQNTQ